MTGRAIYPLSPQDDRQVFSNAVEISALPMEPVMPWPFDNVYMTNFYNASRVSIPLKPLALAMMVRFW